jgi:(1->4)-alpha-D-glucan 1-alpha-D-glucosylmutase
VAAGAVPVSTYRLQLTPDFGFAQAAEAADYLADLGISHVYLSPVLEAVPGSQHGYDVTDHARIRDELGGEDGFRAMAKRLRSRGLGIVVDIVPNHMAIPDQMPLNRQLWSALKDGRDSPYATWFDIDWAAQEGRMLLPILGGPVRDCLGDLVVEPGGGPDSEPVLHYFDHCLPLRPGTSRLPMDALLESQHYRLAWWRDAATELNYRRFFDITSLIGVRMEDPAVFDAAHTVITRLVAEGLVDGLRVDHPDGLADPGGYLRRLAAATGGAWVVVEKILEAGERLPDDWACAGTSGYDALRLADGLFIDPAGGIPLGAEWARLRRRSGLPDSDPPPFTETAETAKREVLTGALRAEVTRLARLVSEVFPEADPEGARSVLTEMLVSLPVYRAYVNPGEPPSAAATAVLRGAVDAARRRLPRRLRGLTADVGAAALGTRGPVSGAAGRAAEFTVRFQQTSGPVQAKGVEDTAFYRWTRLISLNEVGGDPDRFGVLPDEFHAAAARQAARWPATMTTLSTHDTKRQEDVRARLAVLAEIPAEWGTYVAEWHERAVPPRLFGSGGPAVDPDTECLFWQTLVGAWPVSRDRLAAYLTKAIREDKRRTSWTDPDSGYEAAVLGLASRVLEDGVLVASIESFVASIAGDALVNSLGVKLVQLTMPGVPDVYQGCELAGLSLVDPDNRRPVDFGRRRSLLAGLDAARPSAGAAVGGADAGSAAAGGAAAGGPDPVARLDAAKLLVTSRALRLRRDRPDWFAGSYAPLTAAGAGAGHAVAFARGGQAVTVATRLPAGLRRQGGWGETALPLPAAGGWVDVLTGAVHRGDTMLLADLTRRMPVALLVPEVA